jgi:hypothetical protein
MASDAPGPTTGIESGKPAMTLNEMHDVEYSPVAMEEGPLAETMRMLQTQEHVHLVQASRCRAGVRRCAMLQRFIAGRGGLPLNAVAAEVTSHLLARLCQQLRRR